MGLKVTDIQDKNGQSREIQDKDLAGQTSASVINSTDYVMLQDTSGGYHKISRTSFADAVRDVLGSSINSAAKGTDIAKLPVLDSSNNLGMGTLANVATVLGGLFTTIPSGADANDYRTSGKYYIGQGITNIPTLEEPVRCILIVEKHLSYVTQTLYDVVHAHNRVFQRCCDYATWSSWAEISFNIPSFYKNYSDLDALKSGVGVYNGSWQGASGNNDKVYKISETIQAYMTAVIWVAYLTNDGSTYGILGIFIAKQAEGTLATNTKVRRIFGSASSYDPKVYVYNNAVYFVPQHANSGCQCYVSCSRNFKIVTDSTSISSMTEIPIT